jgi:hypothetical protein
MRLPYLRSKHVGAVLSFFSKQLHETQQVDSFCTRPSPQSSHAHTHTWLFHVTNHSCPQQQQKKHEVMKAEQRRAQLPTGINAANERCQQKFQLVSNLREKSSKCATLTPPWVYCTQSSTLRRSSVYTFVRWICGTNERSPPVKCPFARLPINVKMQPPGSISCTTTASWYCAVM